MASMDKKEVDNNCQGCGCDPTDICWPNQNLLREQWLKDNPDAKYEGWMSI
jgi:hypothetical protein